MSNNKKFYKVIIILAIIFVFLTILVSIRLPLPEVEKGVKYLEGEIVDCNLRVIGRSSRGEYGVMLFVKPNGSSNIEKLGGTFDESQKAFYESVCAHKSRVIISYFATRLLVRPKITYSISNIQIINELE